MNLSIAEIAELPLAAALVDAGDEVVARTPEWDGPGPGAVSYPVRTNAPGGAHAGCVAALR